MTDVEESDLTRTELDGPGPPPWARKVPVPELLAEPLARHPSRRPYDLRPGDVIKHYEIIRELGEGGMGLVFLARDTKLGRLVAIKVLLQHSGHSAERFLAEARVTARCKHENIVVIHEVDELRGYPYMVLEYIEGRTLRDWMGQRERPDASKPPAERDTTSSLVSPSLAVELM